MKTYIPSPADTSGIELDPSLEQLTEVMARNVHEVWAAQRVAQGWKYGPERSDAFRTHPCLVPYEELPEQEKEYDRKTAVETLRLITGLGYTIGR